MSDVHWTNYHGAAFKPGSAKYNMKKDIRIDAKVIPCPLCHAPIGEGCVSVEPEQREQGMGSRRDIPAGRPQRAVHTARRRMAIRKLNQERGI